jgi:hypothetical protein
MYLALTLGLLHDFDGNVYLALTFDLCDLDGNVLSLDLGLCGFDGNVLGLDLGAA